MPVSRRRLRAAIERDAGAHLEAAAGARPVRSSPPKSATRSRMPTRPWPPPPARPGASGAGPRSLTSSSSVVGRSARGPSVGRGAGVLDGVGRAPPGRPGRRRGRARRAAARRRPRRAARRAGPARAGALDERRRGRRASAAARARPARSARAARRAGGASRRAPRGRCARSLGAPPARGRGRASRIRRAPPACTTMTLHRVRDDVVHLARDPPALLGDRPPASRLALVRPRAAASCSSRGQRGCGAERCGRRARAPTRATAGKTKSPTVRVGADVDAAIARRPSQRRAARRRAPAAPACAPTAKSEQRRATRDRRTSVAEAHAAEHRRSAHDEASRAASGARRRQASGERRASATSRLSRHATPPRAAMTATLAARTASERDRGEHGPRRRRRGAVTRRASSGSRAAHARGRRRGAAPARSSPP